MKIKQYLLVALLLLTAGGNAFSQSAIPNDSTLRRWAAQMLMVGFKGSTAPQGSDAWRYITQLHVGSIILFDVDLTGDATVGSRNVTSREQLAALTSQLQSYADYPLLIAADQEGGRVQRLKPQYGYSPIPSARHIGQLDNRDSTRHYARVIAADLRSSGVNVNLAPVLDLHRDDCAAIGKLQRSYGDAQAVARHAATTIDEHHRQHVLCAVKHFPGHGNALDDSHWGLVDNTATWQPQELAPYKKLRKKIDMVMTAHIYNRNLDPDYPTTLSRKTIQGVLRDQLGYDGVVVTDDMYMEGITSQFGIENALVLAINAGADIIMAGNNINTGFEADRPFMMVDMIVKAVKAGRIPWGRLKQSHERIERLLKKLK